MATAGKMDREELREILSGIGELLGWQRRLVTLGLEKLGASGKKSRLKRGNKSVKQAKRRGVP